MTWESLFVERLAGVKLANVFNPYADRCPVHDLPDAASIRRRNLIAMLKHCHAAQVDSIWFGRDLGYRGGRRTGLALTDEAKMLSMAAKNPQTDRMTKATHGSIVVERTAAVIWSVIERIGRTPLLWNAFPLHPHNVEEVMSNRAHTVHERYETAWAIEALVNRFGNPRLIAIGNDASKALSTLGFSHDLVRHPSYGGQRDFVTKMERLHGLALQAVQETTPRLL